MRDRATPLPEDPVKLRILAEWYRNGMHDIAQRRIRNGVSPMTVEEIRQAVAGFREALFRELEG